MQLPSKEVSAGPAGDHVEEERGGGEGEDREGDPCQGSLRHVSKCIGLDVLA